MAKFEAKREPAPLLGVTLEFSAYEAGMLLALLEEYNDIETGTFDISGPEWAQELRDLGIESHFD